MSEVTSAVKDQSPPPPSNPSVQTTLVTSRFESVIKWTTQLSVLIRKILGASRIVLAGQSSELAATLQNLNKFPSLSTLVPHTILMWDSNLYNRGSRIGVVEDRRPFMKSPECPLSRSRTAESFTTAVEDLNHSCDDRVAYGEIEEEGEGKTSIWSALSSQIQDRGPKSVVNEAHSMDAAKRGQQASLRESQDEDEGYMTDECLKSTLNLYRNHSITHPVKTAEHVLSVKPTTNPSLTSTSTSTSTCAICTTPLPLTNQGTYSFPQTAPAIIQTVQSLYHLSPPLILPLPPPSTSPALNPSSSSSNPPPPPPLLPLLFFCHTCFTTLHSLHLCWTCGSPIHRPSETLISYGWANWHWSCVACLLCRWPLRPPVWVDFPKKGEEDGEVGEKGVEIRLEREGREPVCRACRREID